MKEEEEEGNRTWRSAHEEYEVAIGSAPARSGAVILTSGEDKSSQRLPTARLKQGFDTKLLGHAAG